MISQKSLVMTAVAGAIAVLASWKLPNFPWLVQASFLASGVGWSLIITLFAQMAAAFLGRLPGRRGAQWRILHAKIHIAATSTLHHALAFLLAVAGVLTIAAIQGQFDAAAKPFALSALFLMVLSWLRWCSHQIAEPLRIEGHRL